MRTRPGAAAPGDPAASSPPGVPAPAEEAGSRRAARPARRGPSASGQWSSRSATPGRAPRRDEEPPSMRSRYPKCQTRPTSTSLSGPGAGLVTMARAIALPQRASPEYDFDSLGRSEVPPPLRELISQQRSRPAGRTGAAAGILAAMRRSQASHPGGARVRRTRRRAIAAVPGTLRRLVRPEAGSARSVPASPLTKCTQCRVQCVHAPG